VPNTAPVQIYRNVFIGADVTILKGVVIGENSIIASGSVVTKSIPGNVIAAGNPCVVIKPISDSHA
jgi:acetyltransferase-like isoleucine patch superfamily enzyme